jgi:XrtJ-associated TM-motif-TM protein
MHKPRMYALCFGLFLLTVLPLHAQGGCVDSPENPTVVLGLIGAAGALIIPVKNKLASFVRGRMGK